MEDPARTAPATKGEALVDAFVASWEQHDELTCTFDFVADELAIDEVNELGWSFWRPRRVDTEREALRLFYENTAALVPYRFPRLFELLLLRWRWARVDVGAFCLEANPPGPGLGRYSKMLTGYSDMHSILLEHQCVQIGIGEEGNIDPVCFDYRKKCKNNNVPIVRIDHEEIICNDRFRVVGEVAPTFRDLMLSAIGGEP